MAEEEVGSVVSEQPYETYTPSDVPQEETHEPVVYSESKPLEEPIAFLPDTPINNASVVGEVNVQQSPVEFHAPLGRLVTVNGGMCDVGEHGYQWTITEPDSSEHIAHYGECFNEPQATFLPIMLGTYVLTLALVHGSKDFHIVVEPDI